MMTREWVKHDERNKQEKVRGYSIGKRWSFSHYFEEPVLVHAPLEELMSIIHQQEVFMRHCRGNIMPAESLLHH